MKTKEFIKIVTKTPRYIVKSGQFETRVSGETDGAAVAVISEEYQNMVDLHYMSGVSDGLFDAIVAYAKTPISKRSTKYHVKIKGLSLSTGDGSYLNFDPINGNYLVSNLNDFFKTKFTDDEIDELVNDPNFFLQAGSYETEEAE